MARPRARARRRRFPALPCRGGAGGGEQFGILYPMALIAGAAAKHQQVCGFGEHNGAAADRGPVFIVLGSAAVHEEQNLIRRGMDQVKHELLYRRHRMGRFRRSLRQGEGSQVAERPSAASIVGEPPLQSTASGGGGHTVKLLSVLAGS